MQLRGSSGSRRRHGCVMLVDAEAAAIVKDAMKTPKRKDYMRCIYCKIVVGEPVKLRGGDIEEESYTMTDAGPVCDHCMKDSLAAKTRVESGAKQDERRSIFRGQVRAAASVAEREERDVEIAKMHDAGMTYTEIASLLGMSKQGVASAARRWKEGQEGLTIS